ncbi:MAG: hypothetical protein OEV51_03235 [Nitrospira sp.]|nr:hypothetical protein [Nitrospira sp.]
MLNLRLRSQNRLRQAVAAPFVIGQVPANGFAQLRRDLINRAADLAAPQARRADPPPRWKWAIALI